MLTKDSIKQFLKPTKKKIFLVIILFIFVSSYFIIKSLKKCVQGVFSYICYFPSESERKRCYKQSDCGDKEKCVMSGIQVPKGGTLSDFYNSNNPIYNDPQMVYRNRAECKKYIEGNGCTAEINENGRIGGVTCSFN